MKKVTKSEKYYEDMIAGKIVSYLKNRSVYLKAENDYLKKLKAMVQK